MTTSFVGLENLPNVYFRDISISSINNIEGQQKFSRVAIKLVVKDTKIDGKLQWVNDDLLNTYLNVKILQSLDKDLTEQITAGQYTLQSFDYQRSPQLDRNLVKTSIKRLRVSDDPELYSVEGDIYEFEYTFSFDLQDSDLINVSYFACIDLNLDMLGSDFSADFNNEQIKNFQGPISSEKVFVEGALQRKTNLFYLPDNRLWSGPVHLNNNNYMAGAFHNPAPHPTLRLVETENLKLKDKRSKIEIPKKLNSFDGKRLFIGKPYGTKDENNNIKKLLYFDMENMFIEKTKYGELIKNLSPKLFQDALNNFNIKKLVIKRKFVKLNKATNSFKNKKKGYKVISDRTEIVTIASDNTQFGFASVGPVVETGTWTTSIDGVSKPQTRLINEFREIDFGDTRYRYFSFVDRSFKDLKYGNYIYGIELSLIDKTKTFLSTLYHTYKNDVRALERYNIRSRKSVNGLQKAERFTNAFAESENRLYGLDNVKNLDIVPWSNGVENYMNLKSYLYDLKEDEKSAEAQKIFNSINPKTGTSKSISVFLEQYRILLNEFLRKFDLEQIKKGTFGNRRSPSNNNQTHPNLISITYNYDDISSATDRKEGYKIFDRRGSGTQKSSFLVLDRDLFNERRKKEINRFFKGKPSFNQDESKNLTQEDIEDLSNIESFSTAYMSPLRIIYESRDIDLSETNLVDNDLLNNTVNRLNTQRRNGRKIFKKNIRLQRLKNKASSNDGDPKFEDASQYLGASSPLLNLDFKYTLEDLEDIERIKVEKKIKDAVSKKRNKKLINKFDLTKKNNIIFKKKGNNKISKRKKRMSLRKIPLHTKALMASRSQNVKTNILNSTSDLLSTDETENKLLIEHFAVQKVEYFAGFKKNKSGNPIFNNPVWKILDFETYKQSTNMGLICRLNYYNDETINMSLPEELSLEVFDKFFIISAARSTNNIEPSFVSSVAINYINNEAINYDYATTNPVSQTLKENSVFMELPEPHKAASSIQSSRTTGNSSSGANRRRRTSRTRGNY